MCLLSFVIYGEKIMLKLNASYSKKVPAEGEYTSQSYHASIEVELPDGLSNEQLNGKIHETFALVKESVEAELHGNTANLQGGNGTVNTVNNGQQVSTPASPKQINYLLTLASRRGITPQQIAAQNNVANINQLSKKQCSALIEQWRNAA